MKYLRKKPPEPIDITVGQRVRMRRMMLGMTQEGLADGLKVSFLQLQKYEKGSNRISASRLQQFAHVLQVPVSFFFDEATLSGGDAEFRSDLQSMFTTCDGLDLAEAFQKIQDQKLRRRIVDLVEQLVVE